MPTPEARAERWKRAGVRVWTIIGGLVLFGVALWVLGVIWPAVLPFLMAAVIVFLLRAPVGWLVRDRVPRWFAVLICYVVATVAFVIAGIFIFPVLAAQFVQFVDAFPTYVAQAAATLSDLTARYWNPAPGWLRQAAINLEKAGEAQAGTWAQGAATAAFATGSSLVTLFIDGVLALFIAFYILADLPDIRTSLVALAGERWQRDTEVVLHEVSVVVGGFLRGQFIVAVVNGVLTAVGLFIIGIPYSGIIGLITGALSVIPYIGPVIGGIIVVITGLFISPAKALLGLAVMVIVQQVEGSVISPRIMSREVDLHPALVIFSLLTGAEVGGLLGMIVAIPIAATGKALFMHYAGLRAPAAAEATASGRTEEGPPKEPPPTVGQDGSGLG